MTADIPPGYRVARPARADLAPVAGLLEARDLARFGAVTTPPESLTQLWDLPRFTPHADSWLIEDAGGRLAGYAGVFLTTPPAGLYADLFVHPDDDESGVDVLLLQSVERRALELAAAAPAEVPVTLNVYAPRVDARLCVVLAAAGYAATRSSFHMVVDLPAHPPHADPPAGIRIETLRPGRDERAVFAALDAAFRDTPRYMPQEFEDFVHSDLENPLFDPGLWMLAWDGGEIAGVAGAYDYPAGPEIDVVAVRPEWRRRGIARALLLRAFATLAQRGRTTAHLSVDAANELGAVQLYESAGMRPAQVFDCFRKTLSPA